MLTKFVLRKLSPAFLIKRHKSKLIPYSGSCRCQQHIRQTHDWKRQMNLNEEKRKIIPKLLYLHNPWRYVFTKFNLLKFRLICDPEFVEQEFIRGAKQAAVVLTNNIRNQDGLQIKRFTTPVGYKQITRDMFLSRGDTRLRLVRFQPQHLRRAIPVNLAIRQNSGYRFCFIDMLFVVLRNTKDFDSVEEAVEIKQILQKLDEDLKTPYEVLTTPHRIVFAEIFIRFRRDYTNYPVELAYQQQINNNTNDWSVAFYKILMFDILNYDPKF